MSNLEKILKATAEGDGIPKIRFDCQNCGRPLVFRDDGRPVQWFNCVCGVGTIYKDPTREGWLD